MCLHLAVSSTEATRPRSICFGRKHIPLLRRTTMKHSRARFTSSQALPVSFTRYSLWCTRSFDRHSLNSVPEGKLCRCLVLVRESENDSTWYCVSVGKNIVRLGWEGRVKGWMNAWIHEWYTMDWLINNNNNSNNNNNNNSAWSQWSESVQGANRCGGVLEAKGRGGTKTQKQCTYTYDE